MRLKLNELCVNDHEVSNSVLKIYSKTIDDVIFQFCCENTYVGARDMFQYQHSRYVEPLAFWCSGGLSHS